MPLLKDEISRTTRRKHAVAMLPLKIIALALPVVSLAQPAPTEDDEAMELEEVVVTGSRIRNADLDSPSPVAIFDTDFLIESTGRIALGDQLAELPQFGPLSTRAASVSPAGGNAGTGVNLLDLRGVGASRTLVLVNGRRHVASTPDTAQPDINTIPSALIERVEVLTGGASSIYGADAIAGVVNIVTRENFEGMEGTLRTGQSAEGDGENSLASITAGFSFDDGRGNLAASLEYAKGEILRYADRDFARQETTIQGPNLSPPPDFVTIFDLRRAFVSNGGTINTALGFLQFDESGNLVPVDLGTTQFPGAVTEGGSGLNAIQDETLIPSLERSSLNVFGSYDLAVNHALFLEAKYVDIESEVFSTAPFVPFVVNLDNPFLTEQARTVLQDTMPAGAPVYVSNRVHRDIGPRGVRNERETSRFVIGMEGIFAERFDYELSYNYGKTDTVADYLNNAILPRIGLAADAVLDADGNIVCRSTLVSGGNSGNPDIDDCVAGNFLGIDTVSQETRDYVNVATRARGKLTQQVLGGFVTTDTTGLFQFPGGPISLVLGGEYREEETVFNPDPRDLVGDTVNAGVQSVDGEFSVAEFYAELVAPVFRGQRYAELLELRGSVRIADYDLEGVGSNTSWGLGGVYAPNASIRFRLSYQEAVRAPNISELFTPQSQSLTTVLDPCSAFGLSQGGPNRRENCAQVVPPGTPIPIPTFNLPVTIGGNPNLDVERGETFTAGIVITPTALPEFRFAVDYYDIQLEDAIFQANPFTNLTLCYDAESLDNPFCDSITRDPETFVLTGQTITPINATGFEAQGLDFDSSYAFDFEEYGALRLRLVASKVLERNDFLDPLDPGRPTVVLDTVGTPECRVTFNTNYAINRWSFLYSIRHFSSQLRTDPANIRSVNGEPPRNPDIFGPDVLWTGSQTTHHLSGRYQINDHFTLFAGIDNITEPDLPPGIYGGGFGGANYDAMGRYYFAGLDWRY